MLFFILGILLALWTFGVWGTIAIVVGSFIFLYVYAQLNPRGMEAWVKKQQNKPKKRRRMPYMPGMGYFFPRWKI